jgi:aspartyl aminopeptidase
VRAIALFDHEEVGSDSAQVGARSPPQPSECIQAAAQRGIVASGRHPSRPSAVQASSLHLRPPHEPHPPTHAHT